MTQMKIYVLTETWAYHGDADCAGWYFTDYADAKAEFDKLLEAERTEDGLLAKLNNECYICEQEDDRLELWLNGDYLCEHYKLVITEEVLHVSDTAFMAMKGRVAR